MNACDWNPIKTSTDTLDAFNPTWAIDRPGKHSPSEFRVLSRLEHKLPNQFLCSFQKLGIILRSIKADHSYMSTGNESACPSGIYHSEADSSLHWFVDLRKIEISDRCTSNENLRAVLEKQRSGFNLPRAFHLFQLAYHHYGLPVRHICLSTNALHGQLEKSYLQVSDDDKRKPKGPRPPIVYVLQNSGVVLGDRDLRERADRYSGLLLVFILLCLFPGIWVGGNGLYYALDCKRWWGWLIVFLTFSIAVIGCLSGGFRAFPWDWRERWREDQNSIQREQYNKRTDEFSPHFQPHTEIVPRKPLDTI